MITFLESQDEVTSVFLKVPDVGCVRAEAIFNDYYPDLRVVLPEFLKPAA